MVDLRKLYLVRWKLEALRKSGRMLVWAADAEAAGQEALARLRRSPVYADYWYRAPFEIVWVRETTGVLSPPPDPSPTPSPLR